MEKVDEGRVWNDCILFLRNLNLISKYSPTFSQKQNQKPWWFQHSALHGLQDACKIKPFSIYPASIKCIAVPNLCSQFASISHNCHRTNHDSPTPVGTSFCFNTMSLYSNTLLSAIWSHFITLFNVMKQMGTIILPKDLGRNEISWSQLLPRLLKKVWGSYRRQCKNYFSWGLKGQKK